MNLQSFPDIVRFFTGFFLSLKLLLESFKINLISDEQVDSLVNIASFLYILYFGYKNNYITKKGQEQKDLLKKHGLH